MPLPDLAVMSDQGSMGEHRLGIVGILGDILFTIM